MTVVCPALPSKLRQLLTPVALGPELAIYLGKYMGKVGKADDLQRTTTY